MYAYMYKKEMKQHKKDLEFQWVTKVLKMYFSLYKIQIDIKIFIQGIFA